MTEVNDIVLKLLNNRGIFDKNDIEEFLSPTPTKTYDPFLLHNMEEGVDLILKTIKHEQKICIYGDYDADGITSISIMKLILGELTDDVDYYIPSRFEEGYGLNKKAIKKICDSGVQLMITVDCGSVSCEEIEYAKNLGMDVLVTDHHTINDNKADCLMINPKQQECNYPFDGLAGCGVAFKVAQGLQQKANLPKKIINEILDIVAIGTIGDIVPLIDENRSLVKYGLNMLNQRKRLSLTIFMNCLLLNKKQINSEQVAYIIAPHLNAAGRMKRADIGVELILSKDEKKIEKLANELIKCNQERKSIQEKTYEECKRLLETQCGDNKFIIIEATDAHEGITGIVAGKLKEDLVCPVIIVTPSEGKLKGTGRSIESVDLYKALKKHKDLFEYFGGHKSACGFLMKQENLELLRKVLNEDLEFAIKENPNLLEKKIKGEIHLDLEKTSIELANSISALEPFGNHNEKPLFSFDKFLPKNTYMIGERKNHARFDGENEIGAVRKFILFNKGAEYKKMLLEKKFVNVVGELSINKWKNNEELQILVRSIEQYS